MSVILLALASGIGAWWVRQTFVWTPLQQFYLSAYARSALASSLAIPTARYRLLLMENRRGSRLAIDEEVVPMSSPSGDTTFALSELARQAGSGRLVWRDLVVNHARVHADLGVWIYRNQTLADLARPSLITAFVVLIAGLLIAIPKDVQWSRSRRHGRRLKGPELVSVRQFNRRTRADVHSDVEALVRHRRTPPSRLRLRRDEPQQPGAYRRPRPRACRDRPCEREARQPTTSVRGGVTRAVRRAHLHRRQGEGGKRLGPRRVASICVGENADAIIATKRGARGLAE
jgi:hypothetical protein